jgi:N4-gp56 family major capsid protein
MAVTTYAALTSFVYKAALKVAEPKLIHEEYGIPITIPEYSSAQVKLARYERFNPIYGSQAASIRQLAEGVVPADTTTTRTVYTITTLQYGMTMRVSDVTVAINEIQPVPALQRNNARNMAETVDAAYRDGIMAGSNVGRAVDNYGDISGAARVNVSGRINPDALDKVIRALMQQDAEFWTDAIGATTKISTAGVLPSYIALVHPDVYYDARKMPGFDEANKIYSATLKGEVGAYKNLRFCMSTMAKIFLSVGAAIGATGNKAVDSTNQDVYPVMVIGREAYAVVKLASMARIIWIPPTQTDHFNPLGQWGTLGWKAQCASGIVNDNWIYRLEVAASA